MNDMPVLVVDFIMPDGERLERKWRMGDTLPDFKKVAGIPTFLDDPKRSWPHPFAPTRLTGTVKAGHADEAREWVETL